MRAKHNHNGGNFLLQSARLILFILTSRSVSLPLVRVSRGIFNTIISRKITRQKCRGVYFQLGHMSAILLV